MPRLDVLNERTLPSTFPVLNLQDSGAGSLRAAVLNADAISGATIDFASGLHGTIVLTSGELDITSSTIINGPGANRLSVSGNNASRVFEIAASQNVTINDLTITHGYASDEAGGILIDGSNLSLSADNLTQNVTFESSATNGARGGGLRSLDGGLTITDCQITGNQALGAAGMSAAGDAIGGGIYILAGSATITTSTISGNVGRGGDNSSKGVSVGGGILVSSGSLTVSNSTFSGKLAQGGAGSSDGGGNGGAIFSNSNVVLLITNSTISNNESAGGINGMDLRYWLLGGLVAVGIVSALISLDRLCL